jgi:hypothetical protein
MTGKAGFAIALVLGLAAVPACSVCDRAGCDATGDPIADTGHTALAGVVASESDVIGNGCQTCTFGTANLAIWRTSGPVADNASARAVVGASAPTVSLKAEQRYVLTLDSGSYLVCQVPDCVSVDVVPGHVTTVHIKEINGPTQFIVFDAQARAARTAATLEIGL